MMMLPTASQTERNERFDGDCWKLMTSTHSSTFSSFWMQDYLVDIVCNRQPIKKHQMFKNTFGMDL